MASRSKWRKIRNNNGTRCYPKGDGKHKCKHCYMYASTERRQLDKLARDCDVYGIEAVAF